MLKQRRHACLYPRPDVGRSHLFRSNTRGFRGLYENKIGQFLQLLFNLILHVFVLSYLLTVHSIKVLHQPSSLVIDDFNWAGAVANAPSSSHGHYRNHLGKTGGALCRQSDREVYACR
jgi:hypothetical protein